MLSLVDGVSSSRRSSASTCRSSSSRRSRRSLIFAFIAFVDLPVALVLLVAALVALHRAGALAPPRPRGAAWRAQAYEAFGEDFLDAVQGLATLKAFGQSGRAASCSRRGRGRSSESTMWVLGTSTLTRGITDTGIAVGAAAALALGAWRVRTGEMELGRCSSSC